MSRAAKPYRLVFFGTTDLAATILQRLHGDADFEIVEVVTQPDRPVGRRMIMTEPPVKRMAQRLELPVYQPETLKTAEAVAHLRKSKATAFVVAAYGKILPKAVLELPDFGCVNVHGSLLPKYRGASPIQAAVAAGDAETGVTIMLMDEKMDEGPVLTEKRVPVSDEDDADSLSDRLAEAGAEMLGPTLKLYFAGQMKAVPQDREKATYTKPLSKDDGKIDWGRGAVEIERLVRAMRPWPEAFAWWNRKKGSRLKVTVKKASVLQEEKTCGPDHEAGKICRLNDGSMAVNCGRGALLVEKIQLEGKGETDGKSFLNGYPDAAGAILE